MRCWQRWQTIGFTFVKDPRTARLLDVLLLTPFLISSGFIYNVLPLNVRVAFVTAGIIVGVWNGVVILLEDHYGTDNRS